MLPQSKDARYDLRMIIISDNGAQFLSEVIQKQCYHPTVKDSLTKVYNPQANPVERKKHYLKPCLAILIGNEYSS